MIVRSGVERHDLPQRHEEKRFGEPLQLVICTVVEFLLSMLHWQSPLLAAMAHGKGFHPVHGSW